MSTRSIGIRVAVTIAGLAASVQVQAQVIEISDDGTTKTYAKPTLFIAGQDEDVPAPAILTTRQPTVDRYDAAAKAEGVDVHLLRAVAWTESRGRQNAISPKGALGVMQLMPSTAAEMGIDPADPEANLHGGARYLARQLSRFQSIPLALAAYNAGPGAVVRWRGIPPYAETQAYVAQILSRYQGSLAIAGPRNVVAKPATRRVNSMLIEVPSL